MEQSKFIERLIELDQVKKSYTAELNRLLNRDQATPINEVPAITKRTVPLNEEELQKIALAQNPVLLSLKHAIEKNEADYKLSKKQYFPSVTVSAMYGQREGFRTKSNTFPAAVLNENGTTTDALVNVPSQSEDRPDVFSSIVGFKVPLWFKNKQNKKVAESCQSDRRSKSAIRCREERNFLSNP